MVASLMISVRLPLIQLKYLIAIIPSTLSQVEPACSQKINYLLDKHSFGVVSAPLNKSSTKKTLLQFIHCTREPFPTIYCQLIQGPDCEGGGSFAELNHCENELLSRPSR